MSNRPTNEVGYGKPPKATQFQKGQSGNPKGRPKGSRNLGSAILVAANERVVIAENGRRRTVTKLEAAAKQLANKAASGNERAIAMLCSLMQMAEGRLSDAPTIDVAEEDRAVMANLAKRFINAATSIELPSESASASVAESSAPSKGEGD